MAQKYAHRLGMSEHHEFVTPESWQMQPFVSDRVRRDVLELVDAFAAHHGLSDSKLSAQMSFQPGEQPNRNLIPRFRSNPASFTTRTADEMFIWFAVNWPADLAWPLHVPRPNVGTPGEK